MAELEGILVSNTYGVIGRELEAEATIKGLDNSNGLDLQFWVDTPSGEHEEIAEIKTKKLSPGEEASYTAKVTPKEVGYYTVYAGLEITAEGSVGILILSGLKNRLHTIDSLGTKKYVRFANIVYVPCRESFSYYL